MSERGNLMFKGQLDRGTSPPTMLHSTGGAAKSSARLKNGIVKVIKNTETNQSIDLDKSNQPNPHFEVLKF